MNRLFSRLDGGEVGGRQSWMLPLDVFESKDMLRIKAALPGVAPEDVHLQVEDNILTISGQRRMEEQHEKGDYRWIESQYGSFSRSVTLPQNMDTARIEARYVNGMLELTVPKREESKPRRIELKLGDTPAAIEAGNSSTGSGSSTESPKTTGQPVQTAS
jgi:HSP20 family protein